MKVKGLVYEITVAAVYCPPRQDLKQEHFEAFFQILGPKFLAGGDYNSKHIQCGSRLTTIKDRELYRVLQKGNYSYLSTGTPKYWPTDTNKTPDLLDFFITNVISTTYTDIQASYDLTWDHTPIIVTISTSVMVRQPAPRLHTSQTNWEKYQNVIRDKVDLRTKLKTCEDVEIATNNFISVLQEAAQEATPTRNPLRPTKNIPSEIKKLVTVKLKARSTWQKNLTPEDRRSFNQASNKLKAALHEMPKASFAA
jgi:hypothetical protein